jgi:hypothetical protein
MLGDNSMRKRIGADLGYHHRREIVEARRSWFRVDLDRISTGLAACGRKEEMRWWDGCLG